MDLKHLIPSRLEPVKRTALDGKIWWVVYDRENNKYSTIVLFGKYRTKKACQYAIDRATA